MDGVKGGTYHSSRVVEAFGGHIVHTRGGTLYKLCGCMNESEAEGVGIPSEMCKKFSDGFPSDWEDILSTSASPAPVETAVVEMKTAPVSAVVKMKNPPATASATALATALVTDPETPATAPEIKNWYVVWSNIPT